MIALKRAWTGLNSATRYLAGYAVFNIVLINLPMVLWSGEANVLQYTRALIERLGFNDSWALMNHALQYLHVPQIRQLFGDKPLYTVLFFDQHVKFIYPPTSLLFLEPLRPFYRGQYVPDGALNLISWVGIGVLAGVMIGIFFKSWRTAGPSGISGRSVDRYALAILIAAFTITYFPLTKAFVIGQIQVWIDVLFGLLVLAWMNERKSMAGICGGLICIIKPQLGLLLVWGMLRKEWRFVYAFAVTVAAVLTLSVAAYGWENNVDYLRVLFAISKTGESCYANQSMNGLLHRILFNGYNLTWDEHNYPPYNPVVYYGTLATSVVLIGAALFYRRQGQALSSVTDMSIAVLSFTLASPIAWEHHYGVLLPMFASVVPVAISSPSKSKSGIIALAISYTLTSSYFGYLNQTYDTVFNFVQSYLFFGALIFLVYLYRADRRQAEVSP